MILTLNDKYQITLPREVREKLNIKQRDHLLVDIQDGMIVLIPQPKRYTKCFQGLRDDIWKGVDVQNYLNGERDAWMNSASDW